MLFYTQFEFLNHHQSTLIQTLPLAKGAKQLLPPEGDLKLHLCPRKYKRELLRNAWKSPGAG